MLEPHAPEIRQELAAVRVAALRDAARPSHAGPLRRAVGNAFVRLGLLLGSDRSVPQVAQHESHQEALAPAGASTFRPTGWLSVDGPTGPALLATELDIAWESAAPFGIRVGDPVNRRRSRSGSRPGAPSARSRGSRRRDRFDAR